MDDEWYRDFFDELYYETYRHFQHEDKNRLEAEFIRSSLGLPEGSRILDLGCGYARHAIYPAKMGYRVMCVDISEYLLSVARSRVRGFGVVDRVEIVARDMREIDYREEFDGAYMFFTTFGYFSDRENIEVINKLSRALKSGGRVLIDLWNPARTMHIAFEYGGRVNRWFEAGDI